jgi:hypothetical protein
LAHHLEHAGRQADLHRLLAAGQPAARDGQVNVWFAAHDRADCVSSYLDDLDRAGRNSAMTTSRALERGQSAASLGMEIRYALMAASIASRTAGIPAGLLKQVIGSGLWTPARGLDHARRLADPRSRLDALVIVHRYLDVDEQSGVAVEALAAATAINDDSDRAQALGSLADRLPADLMPQALAAATAINNDYYRAQALASLVDHLPADRLADVLAVAPRTVAGPLVAVLLKGQSVLSQGREGEWVGLVRNALNGTNRATCLTVVAAIAGAIAEIGGATSISEIVNAIEDARRWWP